MEFFGRPRNSFVQSNTRYVGAIAAGHDLEVLNCTVADAEKLCAANATCLGFTFQLPQRPRGRGGQQHAGDDVCQASPCKVYLKASTGGNSDEGWRTFTKYPRPPSGQGKTECYSGHMFTAEAVRVIDAHDANKPLFLCEPPPPLPHALRAAPAAALHA